MRAIDSQADPARDQPGRPRRAEGGDTRRAGRRVARGGRNRWASELLKEATASRRRPPRTRLRRPSRMRLRNGLRGRGDGRRGAGRDERDGGAFWPRGDGLAAVDRRRTSARARGRSCAPAGRRSSPTASAFNRRALRGGVGPRAAPTTPPPIGHGDRAVTDAAVADRASSPIERRGDRLLNGIYPGGAYTHLLSSKHAGVIQTPQVRPSTATSSAFGCHRRRSQLREPHHRELRGAARRHLPPALQPQVATEMTWAQWDADVLAGLHRLHRVRDPGRRDAASQLDPEDGQLQTNRPVRRRDGRSFDRGWRGSCSTTRSGDAKRDTDLPVLSPAGRRGGRCGTGRPRLARRARRALIGAPSSARWWRAWRDDRRADRDRRRRAPRRVRARRSAAAVAGRARRPARAGRPSTGCSSATCRWRAVPPGWSKRRRRTSRCWCAATTGPSARPCPARSSPRWMTRRYDDPGLVRLRLADAIAAPDNPLTARVAVNRVWRHLFGYGLVRTVDNFGRLGDPPTHPALLDHLAAELRRRRPLGEAARPTPRPRAAAYRMSSQGSARGRSRPTRRTGCCSTPTCAGSTPRPSATRFSRSRAGSTRRCTARRCRCTTRPGTRPDGGRPEQRPRRRRRAPQHLPGDSPQRAQPVPRRLRPAAAGDDARPARRHQRARRSRSTHAQQPVRHRAGGGVGAASRRGRGGVDRRAASTHMFVKALDPPALGRGARAGRRLSRRRWQRSAAARRVVAALRRRRCGRTLRTACST